MEWALLIALMLALSLVFPPAWPLVMVTIAVWIGQAVIVHKADDPEWREAARVEVETPEGPQVSGRGWLIAVALLVGGLLLFASGTVASYMLAMGG